MTREELETLTEREGWYLGALENLEDNYPHVFARIVERLFSVSNERLFDAYAYGEEMARRVVGGDLELFGYVFPRVTPRDAQLLELLERDTAYAMCRGESECVIDDIANSCPLHVSA